MLGRLAQLALHHRQLWECNASWIVCGSSYYKSIKKNTVLIHWIVQWIKWWNHLITCLVAFHQGSKFRSCLIIQKPRAERTTSSAMAPHKTHILFLVHGKPAKRCLIGTPSSLALVVRYRLNHVWSFSPARLFISQRVVGVKWRGTPLLAQNWK